MSDFLVELMHANDIVLLNGVDAGAGVPGADDSHSEPADARLERQRG